MKKPTLFKNTFKLFKLSCKLSPKNVLFTILSTVITTAKDILGVLAPAFLIDVLTKSNSFSLPAMIIIFFCVIISVANMTTKYFSLKLTSLGYAMNNRGALKIGQKGMRLDYKCWDVPDYMENNFRAVQGSWIFMGITDAFFEKLLSGLISFVTISYIIMQVDIFVLLIILLLVVVSIFLDKKCAKRIHKIDQHEAVATKKKHYDESVLFDIKYGKEIRTYNAKDFFKQKFQKSSDEVLNFENKKNKNSMIFSILNYLVIFLQSVTVYLTAVFRYASGKMAISYFLVYYGAVIKLKDALCAIFEFYADISEIEEYYIDINNYLNTQESMNTGKLTLFENNSSFCIEFKNVYFKYPTTEKYILKNISFKLTGNDKLCIVGENGSGKTTLIKLLLRLYDPTSGEILLNGNNIKEYDYQHYLSVVAPVFQDFQLHAFTLRENISFLDKQNDEKIFVLLEMLEMKEKVESLEDGLDSMVTKQLDENGTDFSGGEKQKIAMIRAGFKDSRLVVLDEPTSNIDPLAEIKFYEKINEVFNNKPIVFVSHRMTSAKISDYIIVMDNGEIIESGRFPDLLNQNGTFSTMYKAQANLYKDKGDLNAKTV